MTQTRKYAYTLAQLDLMTLDEAQALAFDARDALLDLVVADGRHDATTAVSYRTACTPTTSKRTSSAC